MPTPRRTHCPDGRPLHRHDDFPEHLATKTMLARQRRRLTPGQPAVASYWTGRDYVPLYVIADTAQLPPMTAKQQARWDTARTCARCATTALTPVPVRDGGRRLDDACWTAERTADATVGHLAARMKATAWARDVLADPDTAVFALHSPDLWDAPVDVCAVDTAGRTLLDVLVWPRHQTRVARPPHAVDADRIASHLYPLVGRRLVHLTSGGHTGGGFADHVTPLDELSRLGDFFWDELYAGGAVRQHRDDGYDPWRRRWVARPYRPWQAGESSLRDDPVRAAFADQAAHQALTGLHDMAHDRHPDGPPACPVLPSTGLTLCAYPYLMADGRCPHHSLLHTTGVVHATLTPGYLTGDAPDA